MNYRAIIHDAWVMTQENKRLIWWFAFVPALLTSLAAMIYISYQGVAMLNSEYFDISSPRAEELVDGIWSSLKQFAEQETGLAVLGIIIIAIFGLTYLMLPVFTQGALIQLIAKYRRGGEISIVEGVGYGFSRFLQMFEYHLFVKTFSFISVVSEAIFVLQRLGPEAFAVFGWFFLIILIVGLVASLLFTYSEYYIVLERKPFFKSILSSMGLVSRHLHHTIFMLILMAIISIRIIINIIVALLIPLLVIGPILFFTSITLTVVGVIVGAVVGLVALYFASYFLGVFHVFATGVWTFTFLELQNKGDDDEPAQQAEDESAE